MSIISFNTEFKYEDDINDCKPFKYNEIRKCAKYGPAIAYLFCAYKSMFARDESGNMCMFIGYASNSDGNINFSDEVFIINSIFVGSNEPCDTNGDDAPDC